jgi:hypothetical protein
LLFLGCGVAICSRKLTDLPAINSSSGVLMYRYPADIYTEPEPDVDTLANLGPLTGMAGVWTNDIQQPRAAT